MLMLTPPAWRSDHSPTPVRPSGQQIHIDISQLKGNMVRVGINAPKDVIIARNELLKPAKVNAGSRR